MHKESTHVKSTKVNGRIFTDIATIKVPTKPKKINVAKPQWCVKVDEKTNIAFSNFYSKKNDMVIPTCIQFTKWKNAGLGVEHVRCDNAGENKLLETKSNGESYNLGLVFEYTARGTPQQNHLAELKLASIANM